MNRSLIAVGVGNTSVQAALFQDLSSFPVPTWHASKASTNLETDLLDDVDVPHQVDCVAVASVNRVGLQLARAAIVRRLPSVEVRVLSNGDFPIHLGQEEPDRVGTDRVAAATATNLLRTPDRPAVFVDAGTALTVNAIRADGVFLGGAILPGIGVSLSTLSHSTDQLPELGFADLTSAAEEPSIGRNTESAIRSGVFWSAIGAIRELRARMADELRGDPQLFVTGGFGQPLADALGKTVRFVPHLVLSGIAIAFANS